MYLAELTLAETFYAISSIGVCISLAFTIAFVMKVRNETLSLQKRIEKMEEEAR